MRSSSGILYEVYDSYVNDGISKGNILFLAGLNASMCTYASFMVALKDQGYRVVSIADLGLDRSEFDDDMLASNAISNRVTTNLELMEAILRHEGKNSSYHVIGHSYGAFTALMLGIRVKTGLHSQDFLHFESSGNHPKYSTFSNFTSDNKIQSLTLLHFGLKITPDPNPSWSDDIVMGGNSRSHLFHLDGFKDHHHILQNASSILTRLNIPTLVISTADDELYSQQSVENLAKLLNIASVVIKTNGNHTALIRPGVCQSTVQLIIRDLISKS